MGYSMEIVIEIWNDATGDYIQVGPDRDGLDMVEIRQYDRNGKIESRFGPITMDVAKLLSSALQKAVVLNEVTE